MLKWGLPGRGVKSAKVPPTPYAYCPPAVTERQRGYRTELKNVENHDTRAVPYVPGTTTLVSG